MIRRRLTRLVLAALAVTALVPGGAEAGPWTPRSGHGEMIFTGTFYRTPSPFDEHGDRQPYAYDGHFAKREVNPFVQVGVTDRVTVLANLFASQQQFANAFGHIANAGLGDSEIGARYRLTGDDGGLVMAVQGLVKLPTSKTGGPVRLSEHQTDVEARFDIGGSFGGGARPPFWNVDAGYRYRHGDPSDEIRIDAGTGVYVKPGLMLLAQLAATTGLRNGSTSHVEGNPTIGPDYDLYRVQVSAVVRLVEGIRLQGGGFAHAAGRNTGAGGGALLSAWIGF